MLQIKDFNFKLAQNYHKRKQATKEERKKDSAEIICANEQTLCWVWSASLCTVVLKEMEKKIPNPAQ